MRFRHEPGTLDVSAFRPARADEDIDLEIDESFEGYKIFDSQKGNTDGAWIAFSRDVDTAERLTALLNADERLKEQAALSKRRATE